MKVICGRPANPNETFASLVVLSFNRKDYLAKSLNSLWDNTSFPYQLIVCDDGSDEATVRYISDLVVQGKVSTALMNSGHNMGIGTAFNRGAAIAQGDYLVKLDADLLYLPNWLEDVVAILDENAELGCLGMFAYHHQPCVFEEQIVRYADDHWVVKDFVGSAIAMRREVYDKYGPWRQDEHHFAEDVAFKQATVAGGLHLGLTKADLLINFGFGEQHSSLIKTVDWTGGRHEYHIPTVSPRIFVGATVDHARPAL